MQPLVIRHVIKHLKMNGTGAEASEEKAVLLVFLSSLLYKEWAGAVLSTEGEQGVMVAHIQEVNQPSFALVLASDASRR